MLTINVAPDGSGQFTTISEAVLAVPYDCPAVIRIAPGIYREKLVCEKKDITLAGAGMDATRLVWNDGGKLPHPDGRPTHTFRSYMNATGTTPNVMASVNTIPHPSKSLVRHRMLASR